MNKPHLSKKILRGEMSFIQKKRKVSVLSVRANARSTLASPGQSNTGDSARIVTVRCLIMCKNTSVSEICSRVQVRKHCALNTTLNDK